MNTALVVLALIGGLTAFMTSLYVFFRRLGAIMDLPEIVKTMNVRIGNVEEAIREHTAESHRPTQTAPRRR